MTSELSPRNWTGWQTENDKGIVIGGGTFNPFISATQSPDLIDTAFSAFDARGANNDPALTTEQTKTRTVGTETTTSTSETRNTLNVGLLGGWLTRITVIILGLIFVAIGLKMFGGPAIIQMTREKTQVTP